MSEFEITGPLEEKMHEGDKTEKRIDTLQRCDRVGTDVNVRQRAESVGTKSTSDGGLGGYT